MFADARQKKTQKNISVTIMMFYPNSLGRTLPHVVSITLPNCKFRFSIQKHPQTLEMAANLETTSTTSEYEFPQVPRDEENFCKSFQLDQVEHIRNFFEQFGFVVIDNVLSEVITDFLYISSDILFRRISRPPWRKYGASWKKME
jgi:hypothetical protein